MFKSEWFKILTTKKMFISIIGVLFIPVLYSGMFLWAFWNPYANVSEIPVAIVNDDKGTTFEGVKIDAGKELTDKLIESKEFNFEEVSMKDAEKRLEHLEYYMIIRIPENFSAHATTLLEDEPSKLVIDYIQNEGYNFIGAQIGEKAMNVIKAEVNTQVSKTYAEQLFTTITTLGDGFTEAADGAGELDEGAQKVVDGAGDLKGYLEQLAASTVELSDGTNALTTGTKKAATGANDLTKGMATLEQGSEQLTDGAKQAATGADQLVQGITQYTDGAAQVAAGQATLVEKQQALANGITNVANGSSSLQSGANLLVASATDLQAGIGNLSSQLQGVYASLPAEQAEALKAAVAQLSQGSTHLTGGLQQLSTSAGQVQQGASQLSTSSQQLVAGQQQVATGADQLVNKTDALVSGAANLQSGNATLATKMAELSAGATSASDGAQQLADGLNTLVNGSNQLNNGTTELAKKSDELATGSSDLATGTQDLAEGTATLSSKLQEASGQVDLQPTDKTYDMVAQPVDTEKTTVNPVPNYGTGFAPYFISLGLFVGALLITIVFPIVEPAKRPTSARAWFFSKVSVLAVVGIIQALISVGVIVGLLGLESVNIWWLIGIAVLTSFTFLAIVQMLVSMFGDPGRFIGIIVLTIQLATSAGTFPIELVPEPLRLLNPFFPMTYSVQAFKAAISTGDAAFLGFNSVVLVGFMVACLIVTFGYFTLLFKKRYSKVMEPVEE